MVNDYIILPNGLIVTPQCGMSRHVGKKSTRKTHMIQKGRNRQILRSV